MISTIDRFKKIGHKLKKAISPIFGTEKASEVIKIGASGDKTTYIDQIAEKIILDELSDLHKSGYNFTIYSEEIGIKKMGDSTHRFVIDPIDGSLNAKRGIPFFSTSIALCTDSNLGSLDSGYVLNLANGDEFYAKSGEGAYFNDKLIKKSSDENLNVLSLELSPKINDIIVRSTKAIDEVRNIRVMGSIALDMCYVALGSIDSLIHLTRGSRPIDFAAAKLILEEAGGIVTDAEGKRIDHLLADLDRKTDLVASKNKKIHRKILSLI